jgi:hypothetical protein
MKCQDWLSTASSAHNSKLLYRSSEVSLYDLCHMRYQIFARVGERTLTSFRRGSMTNIPSKAWKKQEETTNRSFAQESGLESNPPTFTAEHASNIDDPGDFRVSYGRRKPETEQRRWRQYMSATMATNSFKIPSSYMGILPSLIQPVCSSGRTKIAAER